MPEPAGSHPIHTAFDEPHRVRRMVIAMVSASAVQSIRRVRSATGWYDWLVLAACAWVVGGGWLDAWAHSHVALLDTFFTPWHGVLYSGFGACAVVLGGRWLRDRSMPPGYGLSLAGCALFAVGGLLDLLWHTLFGIERQIAAVLSPSHLLLIVAMGLIVTGPLRAARAQPNRRAPLVGVLGVAVAFLYLGLVSQIAQPYVDRLAANPSRGVVPYNQAVQLELFGVMLQSALLVGLVLIARERFELPFGSLTLIVGLQGLVLGAVINLDFMVLVPVLGGLAGDLWLLLLRDRDHIFAAVFPATLYALYVISLQLVYGTWWEIHALTGIVVVAGLTGWLVSLLLRRPQPALA
jgi:hypothetical protein